MKQRLSLRDISVLTHKQQENLRRIWIPERYDIAVSKLITDAQSERFRWLEFAVGDIDILTDDVLLHDLRVTDGFSQIFAGETEDSESFEMQMPASFRKSEALPLLTIGQMISMLSHLDKRKYHFYLLSGDSKFACEIGDFNSEMKAGILNKSNLDDDLCDVLWTLLKTIL